MSRDDWHGHAPDPGEVKPLDQAAIWDLLHPDESQALATAGALIHWAAATPDALESFTAYVEHCPGALGTSLVLGVLAAVHDVLCPECPDAIEVMTAPTAILCHVCHHPLDEGEARGMFWLVDGQPGRADDPRATAVAVCLRCLVTP